MRRTSWIFWFAIVLSVIGFLLYWPLAAAGILLLALTERPALAIVIALVLDVAYGAPPLRFHNFFFPFTLLAICAIGASLATRRYLRGSGRGDGL